MLALALLAALSAAAAPLDDAKLTKEEQATLTANDVVVKGEIYKTPEGTNSGRGKAWIIIGKPVSDVFRTLTVEYDKHPEFMPRLKRVTFVERTPEHMKVAHEVKILFSTYLYTNDLTIDAKNHVLTWALDKSRKADVKDTQGEWRLFELEGGKTLVQYTIAVDSGAFVPKFLEDYLTRKDLPEILKALKRRVESDGKWKKDE